DSIDTGTVATVTPLRAPQEPKIASGQPAAGEFQPAPPNNGGEEGARIYIQVGAFSSPDNAFKLRDSLQVPMSRRGCSPTALCTKCKSGHWRRWSRLTNSSSNWGNTGCNKPITSPKTAAYCAVDPVRPRARRGEAVSILRGTLPLSRKYWWSMSKQLGKSIAAAGLMLAAQQASALNLLQAYDMALQSDAKFAQAAAARRSAEEKKPQAVSRLLPTVNLTAAADNVNNDNKTGFALYGGKRNDSFWNLSLNLKMNQPIYHHDYWVKLGQADSEVAAAEADYQPNSRTWSSARSKPISTCW
ncbi:TolC family protein, partial [Methylogaea oryzae]|uniref:TolC family protein n=2 Tax=Methylogaea oryzae TaxID=1295382 RepID=UPI0020D0E4E6